MRERPPPEIWSQDLRAVLAALARALGGRFPHPEVVMQVAPACAGAVPGHRVTILHLPKGTRLPNHAFFEIEIVGPRVRGTWTFGGGDLNDALAAVGASGL